MRRDWLRRVAISLPFLPTLPGLLSRGAALWSRSDIARAYVWRIEQDYGRSERIFLGTLSRAGQWRVRAIDTPIAMRRVSLEHLKAWARDGALLDRTTRWSMEAARRHPEIVRDMRKYAQALQK